MGHRDRSPRPSPAGRLRRFANATEGNVAIMSGVLISMAMTLAAFAVDEGALYLERRDAQNLADLAAIAAASNEGAAGRAAASFLADNGIEQAIILDGAPDSERPLDEHATVWIEKGRYTPDPGLAPADRFRPGASPFNAARVTLRKAGTVHFAQRLIGRPAIQTSGVAHMAAEAAFSVGSRLASLNGGLVNKLLGGLLGGEVSLSVMDYRALVDSRISLFGFLDALAVETGLTAGTYRDLLDTEVTLDQIAAALAITADGASASALDRFIRGGAGEERTVAAGRLVDLGDGLADLAVGTGRSAVAASVSAMEILGAAATLADGTHQAHLDLGLTVPGLASLTADLAIGEPERFEPWMKVGVRGDIVRTAQTRLSLRARIGGSGVLSGVSIELPLYLELAYAEARLADIACNGPSSANATVTVEARPGVADLRIAEVDPARMARFDERPRFDPASLVSLPLLSVIGSAHAEIGEPTPQRVIFRSDEIGDGTVKTVSTRHYAGSLTRTLIGELDLDVRVGGLGLGLTSGAVRTALAASLGAVADPLDAAVYSLLSALGLRIGEADIRVQGVRCGRAVLVQ